MLRYEKGCEHKILAFHKIRVLDRLGGERDKTDSNNLLLVLGFALMPLIDVADMCESGYRDFFPVPGQFQPSYYMSAMCARLEKKNKTMEAIDKYDNGGKLVRDCGDWIRQVRSWIMEEFDSRQRERFEAFIPSC